METIAGWLGARPYRAAVINALMLAAILIMTGSPLLYAVLGGGAVALGGLTVLVRALARTVSAGGLNPYRLAVTWVPGVAAAGLSAAALAVLADDGAGFLRYVAAVVFPIELAMLVVAGADLAADRPADQPNVLGAGAR